MRHTTPPLPRPVAQTEPEFNAALAALLKAALAVGAAGETSDKDRAIRAASRARTAFTAALEALRHSERLRGREGAGNWISAQMASHTQSSAAPGGRTGAMEVLATVERALQELREARW